MEIDLAEQPSSELESEITTPNSPRQFTPPNFPLNSLMGKSARKSRHRKSEIDAPNSIEFSNGSRAIVCELEIEMRKLELAVPKPEPYSHMALFGFWRGVFIVGAEANQMGLCLIFDR